MHQDSALVTMLGKNPEKNIISDTKRSLKHTNNFE